MNVKELEGRSRDNNIDIVGRQGGWRKRPTHRVHHWNNTWSCLGASNLTKPGGGWWWWLMVVVDGGGTARNPGQTMEYHHQDLLLFWTKKWFYCWVGNNRWTATTAWSSVSIIQTILLRWRYREAASERQYGHLESGRWNTSHHSGFPPTEISELFCFLLFPHLS